MSPELRRLKWRLQVNENILERSGDTLRTDGVWVSERILELQEQVKVLEASEQDELHH